MATVQSVLIVRGDRLAAEALHDVIRRRLSHAQIEFAGCAETALAALRIRNVDLIVTGFNPSEEGDVFALLRSCVGSPRSPRMLVIAGHEEPRLLAALRALAVHGVFDAANDPPTHFEDALALVAAGGRYWSPSICQRILAYQTSNCAAKSLTGTEQLVLSIIGDGSDDACASALLGLKAMTIATVRRNLHRKLGVQHRGDLVRFAAQHGFIRFTTHGVVRPGFTVLSDASRPKIPPDSGAERASA